MIIQFLSMSVNPNLATLMRVIEENQDKMTDGEYLDAMNALCALYRAATYVVAPALASPIPPSSPPYSSIWDE